MTVAISCVAVSAEKQNRYRFRATQPQAPHIWYHIS